MNYVIIGCSAAGINAIEAIRTIDKESKITAISEEEAPLYSRCLLSYFLAGSITEDKVWFRKDSFFKDYKVTPVLGKKVVGIDIKKKEVQLENKKKIKFDRLLIATGAIPKMENIPGIEKRGVFPLRTLEQTKKILNILDKVKGCMILGVGLIGLRAAYALKSRGKEVRVIVKSSHILSQIIDQGSASIMRRRLEANGLKIETNLAATKIIGNDFVKGVILDDGRQIDCELIIVGKGVEPNIIFLKDSGIKIRYGVLSDSHLQTDIEGIFAAGDVCETADIALEETSINAIWPAACEQGRVAGMNMAGVEAIYDGSLAMNSIEFFGLPVISIGITKPKTDQYEELVKQDIDRAVYKKIVLRQGRIVGAIFMGRIENIGVVGALIKKKVDVSRFKDLLLEDYFDYGRILPLVKNSIEDFKEEEFRETVLTYFNLRG